MSQPVNDAQCSDDDSLSSDEERTLTASTPSQDSLSTLSDPEDGFSNPQSDSASSQSDPLYRLIKTPQSTSDPTGLNDDDRRSNRRSLMGVRSASAEPRIESLERPIAHTPSSAGASVQRMDVSVVVPSCTRQCCWETQSDIGDLATSDSINVSRPTEQEPSSAQSMPPLEESTPVTSSVTGSSGSSSTPSETFASSTTTPVTSVSAGASPGTRSAVASGSDPTRTRSTTSKQGLLSGCFAGFRLGRKKKAKGPTGEAVDDKEGDSDDDDDKYGEVESHSAKPGSKDSDSNTRGRKRSHSESEAGS